MNYGFVTVGGTVYCVDEGIVAHTEKLCQEHAIASKASGGAMVVRREEAPTDVVTEVAEKMEEPASDSENAAGLEPHEAEE